MRVIQNFLKWAANVVVSFTPTASNIHHSMSGILTWDVTMSCSSLTLNCWHLPNVTFAATGHPILDTFHKDNYLKRCPAGNTYCHWIHNWVEWRMLHSIIPSGNNLFSQEFAGKKSTSRLGHPNGNSRRWLYILHLQHVHINGINFPSRNTLYLLRVTRGSTFIF